MKSSRVTVGMAMHPAALKQLENTAQVSFMSWDDPRLPGSTIESDALITYTPRLEQETLKRAEKLKVIACHSCPEEVLEWARQRGIVVTDVPSLWDTVADFTLGLLLAAARQIPQVHQEIQSGSWTDQYALKVRHSGRDVFGKTVGIVGLGRIGALVARRLAGFGVRLFYYDIVRKPELERELGIGYSGLEALLASSDYLILLAPLDDSTRGMIGRRQLEQVKQDAILVNTGRGALVDEEALCWALSSGKLAAAALDVYHEEPLPPDHPLLKLDTVIFAPHLGGSTYDCDLVLVTDVIRVLRGETPLHPL